MSLKKDQELNKDHPDRDQVRPEEASAASQAFATVGQDLQEIGHKLDFISVQKPGMRIFKTALAVFCCLMISMLRGKAYYHAIDACISAIIVLKTNVHHTFKAGLSRIWATAIGAFMGLVALQIKINLLLHGQSFSYYSLVVALLFLTIWLTVLLKIPDAAAFAAIVLLATALSNTNQANVALGASIGRFIDTTIGIVVALIVNRILPPYEKSK